MKILTALFIGILILAAFVIYEKHHAYLDLKKEIAYQDLKKEIAYQEKWIAYNIEEQKTNISTIISAYESKIALINSVKYYNLKEFNKCIEATIVVSGYYDACLFCALRIKNKGRLR